jgi:hypothetical protein
MVIRRGNKEELITILNKERGGVGVLGLLK